MKAKIPLRLQHSLAIVVLSLDYGRQNLVKQCSHFALYLVPIHFTVGDQQVNRLLH